jgi:hypothetical protein
MIPEALLIQLFALDLRQAWPNFAIALHGQGFT